MFTASSFAPLRAGLFLARPRRTIILVTPSPSNFTTSPADENLRSSPFCWRVRTALAHKGLAYESIAWRYSGKAKITASRCAPRQPFPTTSCSARCISPIKLLTNDDFVYAWRKRLLDYFDGMAGEAKAREI